MPVIKVLRLPEKLPEWENPVTGSGSGSLSNLIYRQTESEVRKAFKP